jgi:hypothetical protein
LVLGAVSAAQDADDSQTFESQAEKTSRAKFIDFGKELNLPIESLENLGDDIESARLKANPVGLVMAAKLLKAAEDASGKKASLASTALLEEAVTMANRRSNPDELSTIAKLVGDNAAKELKLDDAKKAGEDAQGASKLSGASRDIFGELYVDNHSCNEIVVYVNGYEVGHVPPHSEIPFHVHYAEWATARDFYGHQWHVHFPGHHHALRWIIHNPH